MCGFQCFIFAKIIHFSLISWCDCYLEKLKDQIQNSQNRRSRGKANRIYETYKNKVMPYGRNSYAKASGMSRVTMCAYTQSYHVLQHQKFLLRCCAKFPKHKFSLPRNRLSIFQHESINSFSHLSYNCTLYNTWKDPVK